MSEKDSKEGKKENEEVRWNRGGDGRRVGKEGGKEGGGG